MSASLPMKGLLIAQMIWLAMETAARDECLPKIELVIVVRINNVMP